MTTLSCIEIEPKAAANAAIIWLHGLGASGDDFAPLAKHLSLDDSIALRYVFPHAPQRAVSINGGALMPAWYDLDIEGFERKANLDDLNLSCEQVLGLIEQQLALGIPSERIILAGFSQGGAVAYEAVFRCDQSLAGVMAMSTYIANPDALNTAQCQHTPIWISHGNQDEVVPLELGRRAFEQLQAAGFKSTFSEYGMGHNVCPSQIKDIQRFINNVLQTP